MFISIDIGGTKTRIGFSKDLETFTKVEKFPTPQTLDKARESISKHLSDKSPKAISLGVAGQVDHQRNVLLVAPNIKDFTNLAPKDILPNVTCPIYLKNDAALAALAEANLGAGKGYKTVAYITLSTGVGGSLVIDKKLFKTRYSYEPGHHIIEIGGRENPKTDIEGSWEMYSSGTAFRELYGINPAKCDDPEIWQKYADDLAIGLHNITLLWAPDVIVLGGGISQNIDKFLSQTQKLLKNSLPNTTTMPEIVKAQLGDENGILGGLIQLKTIGS